MLRYISCTSKAHAIAEEAHGCMFSQLGSIDAGIDIFRPVEKQKKIRVEKMEEDHL